MEKKKRGLFDIFASLSKTKRLEEGDVDNYEPFMTNRVFSHSVDSLFHANLMNLFGDLPKEAQMDYYLFAIPARGRYSEWFKPPSSPEELSQIRMQTGCSNKESLLYLELLEQIGKKELAHLKKGGVSE